MIPNTTPTPNVIFNGLMRKMNDTEFRIVMLVVRATLGWEADKETGMRKVEDWISSKQLKEKTGRQSGAISKAIDKCVEEGWIEARDKNGNILDSKGKRKGKNIYFRLGKAIMFDTSSESEDVIVKDKKDYPTSSETANAETANAESEDYKRNTIQNKNITKISAGKPQEFVLEDKLKQMEDDEKREDLQIIASFIRAKKLKPNSSAELTAIIKRHLRAAKQLIPFSTKQLVEAKQKAEKMCGDEYTLETILKYLTK